MLGSAASVSNPNVVLNTAVAEALEQFYHELEGTKPEDMEHAVHELIKRAIRKHKKVVFNGNGYTDEWVKEAEARGLYNLPTTPDCLPKFIEDKNVELFTKHGIFTKEEIFARYEILLENYVKTIGIEARTMADMLTKDFLPSVSAYAGKVAGNAANAKAFMPNLSMETEEALVKKLTDAYKFITDNVAELKTITEETLAIDGMQEAANACRDKVLPKMDELAACANEIEALIPDDILPYPTYEKLLFAV